MRLKLFFLLFIFGAFLNGCHYLSGRSYQNPASGIHWIKKGVDDKEMYRFQRKCFPRRAEMYKINGSALTVELEIEGQRCMLEHGFNFKDSSYPDEKLCSRSYAKERGIKSYMIFPACQAKYGQYRK